MTRTSNNNLTNHEFHQMNGLKEKTILCKGMTYFFLPIVIFGAFSAFFPSIYALFPVQESAICICSFFEM